MIKLQDMSELMQKVIETGATFMISQSGVPGYYSIYAAYHSGAHNRQVRLTFHEKDGIIVQYADLEHCAAEFDNINSVFGYICRELDMTNGLRDGAEWHTQITNFT